MKFSETSHNGVIQHADPGYQHLFLYHCHFLGTISILLQHLVSYCNTTVLTLMCKRGRTLCLAYSITRLRKVLWWCVYRLPIVIWQMWSYSQQWVSFCYQLKNKPVPITQRLNKYYVYEIFWGEASRMMREVFHEEIRASNTYSHEGSINCPIAVFENFETGATEMEPLKTLWIRQVVLREERICDPNTICTAQHTSWMRFILLVQLFTSPSLVGLLLSSRKIHNIRREKGNF